MDVRVVSDFGRYFKLPHPGLKGYFHRVAVGQPDEFRTTFFKGRTLSSVLDGWSRELGVIKTVYPSLFEFENDLRKKVGPMSIMLPLKDRMNDIANYYDLVLLEAEDISSEAVDAVVKEWTQVRGLVLRNQQNTVELMKKSTNSGNPYFTKRKLVLGDTIPCFVWSEDEDVFQELRQTTWDGCAILGWRGQEGGPTADDVKQRVVFMFPFAVNVQELQFYQPAIEAAQRFNIVPAWVGMESVDLAITKLFDTKKSNDLVVCTDFSKFDQHFNATMQSAAQCVISRLMAQNASSVDWLERVFPIKYKIPLCIQDRTIVFGDHGMGSGSGGTNFDETLTHRALQHEVAMCKGAQLNPYSMCLGDDGVLSYPGIRVEDIVEQYTRHGQECNPDKQYASPTDCVYLRRWHQSNYRMDGICVGVYSTYRALGRLCEQERYYDPKIWGPEMVALRQLSILENVKYHPLREEFLRYCMKGDRYRLGIDLPGFFEHIADWAQKATDYMPDFLGYTRSLDSQSYSGGIKDWWVVKTLSRQR